MPDVNAEIVDPRRASTGLTIFLVAEVTSFALWEVVNRLEAAELIPTSSLVMGIETAVDFLIGVVACIALFMVSSAVRPALLATVTAGVWSMATLYFPASAFIPRGDQVELTFAVTVLSRLFSLAMKTTLALVLVQLAGWRRRWILPVQIGVVALAALNGAFRLYLSSKLYLDHDSALIATFSTVTAVFTVSNWVAFAATCVCLFFARLAVLEGPSAAVNQEWTSGPSSTSDLVIGGVVLAVAIAVTVGSFLSSAGGGYVVTIGLFAFGIARIVRGIRGLNG